MQDIDFFSVRGRDVNRIFGLNLLESSYYNWDEVKLRVNEMEGGVDEKKRGEMERFDLVMVGRRSRLERVKGRLEEREIKFLPHSYLLRQYVMYGRGALDDVVRVLYRMKILFERCDIRAKWEGYKVSNGSQMYSFEEKDKFYEGEYNKYIDLHPSLAF